MKSAWFLGSEIGRDAISRAGTVVVVLASASKDRLELMRQIGIDPVVVPSNCPEDLPRTMQVAQFVEQTARQKAVEVAKRLAREKVPFDALVGCDTMISVDGELVGKPKDAEDAFKILRMLSARSHVVRTGVCIVDSCGAEAELFSVESRVEFGQLSDELIKQYIMTGEPMNRAGAYAIQGKGAVLVKAIFGSFSNIVGLPLFELVQKLDKLFTKKE